jgi:membrane protease YdiL (CAAX protease family)
VVHVMVRPSVLSVLTFFPALMVGTLFQRQRRLLPCIALHAAFNATWLALFGFTA